MSLATSRTRWLLSAGTLVVLLMVQAGLAAVQRVDSATVRQLIGSAGYAYLDVRLPEEHRQVRVPGSVNIPWSLNTNFVQQVRARFPNSKQLLVVGCRSGSRSAQAAAALAPLYPNLVDHQGGILAWLAAKLPVATG